MDRYEDNPSQRSRLEYLRFPICGLWGGRRSLAGLISDIGRERAPSWRLASVVCLVAWVYVVVTVVVDCRCGSVKCL